MSIEQKPEPAGEKMITKQEIRDNSTEKGRAN